MKTRRLMAIATGVALLATGLFAAPSVEITSVQQQYPWTNTVDIVYTVAGVDSETNGYFVVFTPTTSTGAAIPDVNGETSVQVALKGSGVYSTQWFPQTNQQYTACKMTPSVFRGAAKDYMIVDLETGAVTYEPMATQEASNQKYTSDLAYRKTKMVFRRIAAGTYDITDGTKKAAFDKDFYIGIFEVTIAQYNRIMDSGDFTSVASMKPKANISWNTLRGNALPAASVVANKNGGVIARLKYKTNLSFDLPNYVMFEVARRAGCPKNWVRYWGTTTFSDSTGINDYEWWNGINNGVDDGFGFTSGSRVVGCRKPNAWGLYDTISNAREICRDATTLPAGAQTGGPQGNYTDDLTFTLSPNTVGAQRIVTAGPPSDVIDWLRCSSHWSQTPNFSDGATGFRLSLIVE